MFPLSPSFDSVCVLRFPKLEISSVQINSKSCMGSRQAASFQSPRARYDGSASELKRRVKGGGRRWDGVGLDGRSDSIDQTPQPRSHAQTTPAGCPGPGTGRPRPTGLQRGREDSRRVGFGWPRPTRTDAPAQARARISEQVPWRPHGRNHAPCSFARRGYSLHMPLHESLAGRFACKGISVIYPTPSV